MDFVPRPRSPVQLVDSIISSLAVIRGRSQLLERRMLNGTTITPDFLSSSLSSIQRASDAIAVDVRQLYAVNGV